MAKQLRNAFFAACFGTLFLFVSTSDDGALAEIEAQRIVNAPDPVISRQNESNDVVVPLNPSIGYHANFYTGAEGAEDPNDCKGAEGVEDPNDYKGAEGAEDPNDYKAAEGAEESIYAHKKNYGTGEKHVAKDLKGAYKHREVKTVEYRAEESIYEHKTNYGTGEKHIAKNLKGAYKDREGKTVQYNSRYKKQLENSDDPKDKQYKGLKGSVNSKHH